MREIISRVLGKDRRRPLNPEPKMETVQTNLKDFNTDNLNNTNNVMDYLNVDRIIFERGGFYDEEE
ncbi:MAG: hypothetical protein GTN76_01720 [Candidatus Aenigmarchaeota archaeon]|nr:hypothetical protein [Candidatus Aenigmarchaeota archaeon]